MTEDSATSSNVPIRAAQTRAGPRSTAPNAADLGWGLSAPYTTQLVWRPLDGGSVTTVALARDWLTEAMPRIVGPAPRAHLQDDIQLLLCELVANAVLHADGVTLIRIRRIDQTMRVSVSDGSATLPIAQHAAPDADCGRGIALVELLALRWGVEHDQWPTGKCVWLELSTTASRGDTVPVPRSDQTSAMAT